MKTGTAILILGAVGLFFFMKKSNATLTAAQLAAARAAAATRNAAGSTPPPQDTTAGYMRETANLIKEGANAFEKLWDAIDSSGQKYEPSDTTSTDTSYNSDLSYQDSTSEQYV